MISVVDLRHTFCERPFLSAPLIESIHEAHAQGKKSLLFFYRRGLARSLVCSDCGTQVMCPYCDVALVVHASPSQHLLCHHCGYTSSVVATCSHCHGTRLKAVGTGIQTIEKSLHELFPSMCIGRIDSDSRKQSKKDISEPIENTDIILATHLGTTYHSADIGLVAFLLIEADMTLPEYDMEEHVYIRASHALKRGVPTIIQTYRPESDLLRILTQGNYKDFLTHTLAQRKAYGYPPYGELATLWIHDRSEDRVRDMIYRLVTKLTEIKSPDIFLGYDKEVWTKRRNIWMQKIILKGPDVRGLLDQIRGEIVKNRGVSVEWK